MYTRNPASPARPTRRSVLALAAAPLLAGMAGGALAETGWPSKMLRLVVPFPAGGPTDTASRIVGQKLGERLKQTDRKSTRLNSSHLVITYAVFCLEKKTSLTNTLLSLYSRLLYTF